MATLKDIANKCGLSVATVSKAMNNMPDISPATAQRVQEIAREMGYMPNSAARSMKTGRSMTIGLVMFLGDASVWTHQYSAFICDSIHRTVEVQGYDLTPVSAKGAESMGGYLNYCRYRNYDGVIIMTGGNADSSLDDLISSDFPLVSIDCEVAGKSCVTSDNIEGMRRMVQHVFDLGHRRLAFIHGQDTSVTRDRVSGFLSTCNDLGLTVPDSYLKTATYLSQEEAAAATRELLTLDERPSCIFFPDDYAALGGLRVLKAAGLSVPEDISAIGYDGSQIAEAVDPPLATYSQDCEKIGASAAELLLRTIAEPRGILPRRIIVTGHMIEGGSIKNLKQSLNCFN